MSLISSIEGMVGASVKGLIDLADGYIHGAPESTAPSTSTSSESRTSDTKADTVLAASLTPATTVQTQSLPPPIPITQPHQLITTTDVPSGWIHLQSTYLDENGSQRKVKWFGVRCLVSTDVEVEIGSDLGGQLCFWVGDDEKPLSSTASTASSVSNTSGSTTLRLNLSPQSQNTIYLSFQPFEQDDLCPTSPTISDGGVTPRIMPVLSRTDSSDMSSVNSGSVYSESVLGSGPRKETSTLSDRGSSVSGGNGSGQSAGGSGFSAVGSYKGSTSNGGTTSTRRFEPVHRSFSIHGSIWIRATANGTGINQQINLPFFATVCRSLFTAALIDPVTNLASGSQQSSGQLTLDFGSDSIVGGEYHRDILLVNRSEIELVWMTAVVNSRYKDQVWFSLRDLDSENVFGIGSNQSSSSQPLPLPALSSRHLRLELRVKQPVVDFDFDFVISNINQSGNTITCKAIGSGSSSTTDSSLKILSGNNIDFGQICDGIWGKKMITCKNDGERPLDVSFSCSTGYDVVFRLAGVAGEDMDEDIPIELERVAGRSGRNPLSRISTREKDRGRERETSSTTFRSRNVSPSSSLGRPASSHGPMATSNNTDPGRQGDTDSIAGSSGITISEHSSTDGRDGSRPPSRALSRVTSRASSHRHRTSALESDEEDDEIPFFNNGDHLSVSPTKSVASTTGHLLPVTPPTIERNIHLPDDFGDKEIPNQIEELTMRPGTEYRVFVLYKPKRDTINPPEVAGQLRSTNFKVYLDSSPTSSSSNPSNTASTKSRKTLNCTAESCTSLISITSGRSIDFGSVTVGASKSSTISIKNLSALSARIEIAAISKVLSANRNVVVVPPFETVEERLEFFPRRINEKYEKQLFIRNLLNRGDDQLIEIRSKNVDVYNVTLHSHLYRILTPSGSNFLDFGSVVINSSTIRTIQLENLSHQQLLLELSASQPEDVEMYLKLEDVDVHASSSSTVSTTTSIAVQRLAGKYAEEVDRVAPQSNSNGGELKERFMESLQESEQSTREGRENSNGGAGKSKTGLKGKAREKSVARGVTPAEVEAKQSVAASVAAALKKGGRGRPVLLYGNAVVFKDRNLLEDAEYLDLATGPPVAAHRASPRSKKTQLLDTIELEDRTKLSGQHPKIPKLDFAASAKATGLRSKDVKSKKVKTPTASVFTTSGVAIPVTPAKPKPSAGAVGALISALSGSGVNGIPGEAGTKSPALTAKRVEPKTELFSSTDVSKLPVDELLIALEQHDSLRTSIIHSTPEEEESFVRRTISLRKEMSNLVSAGRLVPVRTVGIQPGKMKQLIVVMTPNGSIRPHITTRPKRSDSRIFIKLLQFDKSFLSEANPNHNGKEELELPVRDLVIRSSCVRSVLEVQQSSINFGACEKGDVKSKTIVIHNKSDCIGIFRMKLSGSIASGNLKLGLGRYGVISAFGRKEVVNFTFTPSLVGNFQETIVVENVLDGWNDQNVSIKAAVRKMPSFAVEPAVLDFGIVNTAQKGEERIGGWPEPLSFILTNVSKHERTFLLEVQELLPLDATSHSSSSSTSSSPPGSSSLASSPTQGLSSMPSGTAFAQISLIRDDKDAGTALSQLEEEELEALLQKLKIARRKGKADKIAKYKTRLGELGAEVPEVEAEEPGEVLEADAIEVEVAPSGAGTPADTGISTRVADALPVPTHLTGSPATPKPPVTSLSVTLLPSQKHKILVQLLPRSPSFGDSLGTGCHQSQSLRATIRVHDRKNTDETLAITVMASPTVVDAETKSLPVSAPPSTTSAPLNLALMRHCLELSALCPVSPTAFCVGSTLFLPSSSELYPALLHLFPMFSQDSTNSPAGLILADGYSRQIPGNTHAEANALSNFRARYAELSKPPTVESGVSVTDVNSKLPPIDAILKESECYATMEPCSIRTSGRPSCALDLVRAGVKMVYLGVEEPPDFVECEGVRILEDGGVQVKRVIGLEEECLKAARRGR